MTVPRCHRSARRRTAHAAACCLVLTVSSCRSGEATTAPSEAVSPADIAARSASACLEAGAEVLLLRDCATSQRCQAAADDAALAAALPRTAFCQLDRGYILAATFTRLKSGDTPIAASKYLARNRFEPNGHSNQPADYYCTTSAVGGKLHTYLSPSGGEVNFCEFPDGSSIGDWTLYYGSGTDAPPTQQKLIKMIRSAAPRTTH